MSEITPISRCPKLPQNKLYDFSLFIFNAHLPFLQLTYLKTALNPSSALISHNSAFMMADSDAISTVGAQSSTPKPVVKVKQRKRQMPPCDEDQFEEIISEYEKHPVLYDPNRKLFKRICTAKSNKYCFYIFHYTFLYTCLVTSSQIAVTPSYLMQKGLCVSVCPRKTFGAKKHLGEYIFSHGCS